MDSFEQNVDEDSTVDPADYPEGRDTSFQGPAGNLGGDREIGATAPLGDTGEGVARTPGDTTGGESGEGTQGGPRE